MNYSKIIKCKGRKEEVNQLHGQMEKDSIYIPMHACVVGSP